MSNYHHNMKINYHDNVKSTLTTHDCGGLSMNVSEYVMCIVVKRLWKNHLFSNHASHTIIGYFGLTEWYYPDYFLTFQCRTLKWPKRWMSLKHNCCTIHCRRYKKLLCLGIVFWGNMVVLWCQQSKDSLPILGSILYKGTYPVYTPLVNMASVLTKKIRTLDTGKR